MKLNLGSRETRIPGFKNVDIEKHKNVDIVCDISHLDVKDGQVEEIYSSHCLEHFPHTKTVEVLKEWRRVLKKGGKLYLAVPSWDAVMTVYKETGLLGDWLINFMYGDQIYDKAFHYTIFNYARLARFLSEAGFEKIEQIDTMPYGLNDCSKLKFSGKTPISLNVVAS